jgi:hypothetical protein
MFGRIANLLGCLQKRERVNYNLDSYVQELNQRLQHSYAVVNERLEAAKKTSKDYYDKQIHVPKFQVGDLILLQHESPRKNRSRKLGPGWRGPYTIKDIECAGVYIVRLLCMFHPLSIFGVRNFLVPLPPPLSVTVFWLNRFLNGPGDLTLCVVFNLATTSSKFRLAGASKLLSRPAGMVTHQGPRMTRS